MAKRLTTIAALALGAFSLHPAMANLTPTPYSFFIGMGQPAAPQPWDNVHQGGWDVIVHTREQGPDQTMPVVQAEHGSDCSAPPATHPVSSVSDSVFICRDHLMTAVNDTGFGAIVMTPPQLVDFTNGSATIDFNVSTLQMSQGTWVELWLTPFADNLVLPSDNIPPDLSGPPRNAIHVPINTPLAAGVYESNNFNLQQVTPTAWQAYSDVLTPQLQSAVNRTHFQLTVSQTHVRYSALNYDGHGNDFTWTDANLPVPLNWSQGVLQLMSASYNPEKPGDCESAFDTAFNHPCTPDTWHWSNLNISSAVPFTIDHGSPAYLGGANGSLATLEKPSPAGGYLRFAAKGSTEVSFDGGASWQPAGRASESVAYNDCQFENYWMPAPSGINNVMLRGAADCYGQPWTARDISVWSLQSSGSPQPGPTPAPTPRPTPTPAPTPAPTPTVIPIQGAQCTVQVGGQSLKGTCTGTFSQT